MSDFNSQNETTIETTDDDSSTTIVDDSNNTRSLDEVYEDFETDKEFPDFKGWEAIGFHRPLAGELWEVILELVTNVSYVLIIAYLVPLLEPFPEISGYRALAFGLFTVIFNLFDVGTNFGLGRFIAEYRTKDPRKMMEYVNFFVRYQMWTGLIQVTLLSYWTFAVIKYGDYGYLLWIILLHMQKQYPGMLGIFKSVLAGMQYYGAVKLIGWIQSKGIELFLNFGIILFGRWYGQTHPEMGLLWGIVVFGVIGNYIDDIIMFFGSGYYLNKILKNYMGTSLLDAMNSPIGKDVKRNAVKYGVPGSVIPLVRSVASTWILLSSSALVGGYISWVAIVAVGARFSGIVKQIKDFDLRSNVAESYMTGKKKLCEYYISASFRWRYFFQFLLGMAVVAVIPFFYIMVEETPGLAYYLPAFVFLVPALIKRYIDPILGVLGTVMVGARHINQYNVIRLIEEGLRVLFIYLWLYVWEIQNSWEPFYMVLVLFVYSDYIPYIIKSLLCYFYIRKYIGIHIKIYFIPTILIPFVSALPAIGFARLFLVTGWPPLMDALGFEAASMICYGLFFFILVFTYPLATVLLGGWTDYDLWTFKKAVALSGPSKFLFKYIYRALVKCRNLGVKMGTHGKFPIPHDEAHKEVVELMYLKRKVKEEMMM